jgi:hypothetical protein
MERMWMDYIGMDTGLDGWIVLSAVQHCPVTVQRFEKAARLKTVQGCPLV